MVPRASSGSVGAAQHPAVHRTAPATERSIPNGQGAQVGTPSLIIQSALHSSSG